MSDSELPCIICGINIVGIDDHVCTNDMPITNLPDPELEGITAEMEQLKKDLDEGVITPEEYLRRWNTINKGFIARPPR